MSQTIYDTTPMRQVFKEGTWDVKLSFLVMGLANLVNKQFTKGLLFLLSEIAFLAAFVIQIIPALQGMITLGTQEQGEAIKEVNGIKLTVQVAGDNSMLMLIFGLASVIFCAVFAYIYWCNLKSARHLMALKQSGRKVPNFIEDFKTLADGRFHMGLMSIPLIGVLLFTILLVATGIIMNLPTEQIEAAEIDGASKFQIFKNITFPQILLIMAPSLIQQFIGNINNFNVIYFLTGGGPTNSEYYQAGSTDLLVTWLYKLTVSAKDYNLASVIGILIFAISATFSLLAYTRSSSFKEGAAK